MTPNATGGQPKDGRKIKGTIHWVSADHAKDAEVRLYDRLFKDENPTHTENFLDSLNPNSLETREHCKVEPSLEIGPSARAIPIRATRLLLRRPRLDAREARFQPDDHVEGHVGRAGSKREGGLSVLRGLSWFRDDTPRARDAAFCRRMLPQVSRTFALSIAMLPPTLRDAVGDAYLICRIVDSIEDDARLSHSERLALFDAFDSVIADDALDERVLERAARKAAVGETAAESELCARSGAVMRAFRALDRSQREAIRPHVLEMSRGMREYAARAARDGRLRIADVADLERYCYFVAGTVGELLTDLFALEVPGIDARTLAELRRLAVPFGIGLQLVNIVKDVAGDLERGVCFLPASLAAREGVALEELLEPARRAKAMRVVESVCDLAEEKLRDAQTYTLAWPRERAHAIRLFCSVPLVLALASLRVVRDGTRALVRDTTPKVGRVELFTIVRDVLASIDDDRALAGLFARHASYRAAPRYRQRGLRSLLLRRFLARGGIPAARVQTRIWLAWDRVRERAREARRIIDALNLNSSRSRGW